MNLCDHLTSQYVLCYNPDKKNESKKKTLNRFIIRPAKCSDALMKNITDRVTQMIVQDLRPIRVVECEGFRNLINYLETGYIMLSKKQFTTDINYKVQRSAKRTPKERSAVYNINNRYMVKLGNRKLRTYLLVTAHYIDINWELQAFVLETLSFPERHTGVNIADKLKGLVERWAIMDSVIYDGQP